MGTVFFFLADETDEMQGNLWAWQGKGKSLELLISYWVPLQQPMPGERGVESRCPGEKDDSPYHAFGLINRV